jgi:hypothetical protein
MMPPYHNRHGVARDQRSALLTKLAFALVAIAVILRLGFLSTDSFWLDEAFSVRLATQTSIRPLDVATRCAPPVALLHHPARRLSPPRRE